MKSPTLLNLVDSLNQTALADGSFLNIDMFESDNSVACITINDREELPIYMTVDAGQILVITYLFSDSEIKIERKADLLEAMLILNVSIPLSAFSKISDQYIMFGALSPESKISDLIKEIETLSDNVLEAIEAVGDYLTSNQLSA
ncbi:DUF2170 family protein [Marinicellulosiphila megalodicopiae]|uniref:DUF2170 family protein n=1 Tax=Marinicellulosiphila megalodicopiae TaxID=2724896 RepID=UPI003BB17F5C